VRLPGRPLVLRPPLLDAFHPGSLGLDLLLQSIVVVQDSLSRLPIKRAVEVLRQRRALIRGDHGVVALRSGGLSLVCREDVLVAVCASALLSD
jgi:hypothetical protein